MTVPARAPAVHETPVRNPLPDKAPRDRMPDLRCGIKPSGIRRAVGGLSDSPGLERREWQLGARRSTHPGHRSDVARRGLIAELRCQHPRRLKGSEGHFWDLLGTYWIHAVKNAVVI